MRTKEELIERQEKNKQNKERMVGNFGSVLSSIWVVESGNKSDRAESKVSQLKERDKKMIERMGQEKFDELRDYISCSGITVRSNDIWAVSKFPENICNNLIKFYSQRGDTILDPCAGHNSRMERCFKEGRNYIGYDVSEEYMKENERIKQSLLGNSSQQLLSAPENTITLHKQSSEKMEEKDNSVDFIFTSPPYWDIEFFGEEKEQIGYKKTYPDFLAGIQRILSECHRTLKPDKFCAIQINDFRKGGVFYPYHSDIINLGIRAGFKLFDIIIMEYKTAFRMAFISQIEDTKIMPKRHEYIIIFKKTA